MIEKRLKPKAGMPMLVLFTILYVLAIALIIFGAYLLENYGNIGALPLVIGMLWAVIGAVMFFGLKVVKPNEALVLTLFGEYLGSITSSGFYYVHPFAAAINPAADTKLGQSGDVDSGTAKIVKTTDGKTYSTDSGKKISLKIMTLNNSRQKVNDVLGNPIEIGIAVMWQVVDTAKAVFNVDNYKEYLSLQCDSAVRNIVRIYPYDIAQGIDTTGDGEPDEGSLRGSSAIVAERIREEIQAKVLDAGLEIVEGSYYLPGLCTRNRSRHASKTAGKCCNRRKEDDC